MLGKRKAVKKAKIAVGTALGAALAAGAAAYFFTQTKTGKQAAKAIKEHAVHLSKEITTRVEKAKNLTQKKYNDIVDDIVDEYGKKKKLAQKNVDELKKDLKSHWKEVNREVSKKTTPKKRK